MTRPRLLVLAGVNGAGKSSVGGDTLRQAGMAWFNPDDYARDLLDASGCTQTQANAQAWQEGMRRLEAAITGRHDHAFETTLGGNTIPARLREAADTHDLMIWFCGLDSPERHIARVRLRVAGGGHDIPEAKIRERCVSSIANLITLLPHLTSLQVYDNSTDAAPGTPVSSPRLLLQMHAGRIDWPTDADTLGHTPDWAKPIMEAALTQAGARG
ncbi:hypothetical protein ACOPJQ_04840 [Luteimonas dalianensis]|uniref:hypothetical protein n=1 Tax=Luteimonas dalianensis TaxID=1148196 RepID=UPI003BF30DF4